VSQGAHGVTHVLPEILYPGLPAGIANVVFERRHAADLDARRAHRSLAAQAGVHVAFDGLIEIGTQFLVQVLLGTISSKERADAAEHPTEKAGHQISPSEARMMRVMAAVCASQSCVA
jgi:hypothetical protein